MQDTILVVETGGTFATVASGNIRSLDVNAGKGMVYGDSRVVDRVEKYNWKIEVIRPIYTLSENMTFDKLNALLECLWALDYSKYKGIIITHGTDTMAYTANLLSMLFGRVGVPIMLVSSNHPLVDQRANGMENFLGAMDFIATADLQGVYVVYKDYKGIIQVHLGSRIKQMNQIIDAYESFKDLTIGEITDGNFKLYVSPYLPDRESINDGHIPINLKPFTLGKRILLVYPYVGLRYDYFNIDDSIDGIVCGVYHSGTVCVENNAIDQSINTLIEKAEKNNIPVFIGELSSKNDHYDSFTNLVKSDNVFPIYDISLENLYVKAHIALSVFEDIKSRESFINNTNVFFEKVID
ncbi:MAG: hypothetical protein GXZ11_06890 [Tissierellia bacterium]|nr:hypothetical protein [Tissierellia bacterium]